MPTSHDIEEIGKLLIRYYIERRRYTVVETLVQLRPDLIEHLRLELVFPIPNLAQKIAAFKLAYTQRQIDFIGVWQADWKYRLHGYGCFLQNIQTGENFDWDMSDPMIFYRGEFESHLIWRCKNEKDSALIQDFIVWQRHNPDKILWDILVSNRIIEEITEHSWVLSDFPHHISLY